MGLNTAPERPVLVQGDIETPAIDNTDWLESSERVASVTSITEQTTTDLTITDEAVSTTELTINDKTVAIGKAVQFKVVGQLAANSPYSLVQKVVTDSTPARTKNKEVIFHVETLPTQ